MDKKDLKKLSKLKVGRDLIDSFTADSVGLDELTKAEQVFQNINFDEYIEKAHCQILTGVHVKDLRHILSSLSRRFELAKDISETILDGEFALHNDKVIREFRFKRGEKGHVRYGRVATIKRDQYMDIAYSVYVLDFKFSSYSVQNRRSSFLWMLPNSNRETEERSLASDEKENLLRMIRHKAMTSFQREYPMVDDDHVVRNDCSFKGYSSDGLVVCCCAFM